VNVSARARGSVCATLAEGGGDEVLAGVRDVGEVLNGGLARLRHGERLGVFLLVGGGERALVYGGGDTQVLVRG
jgi:hypothetical protein